MGEREEVDKQRICMLFRIYSIENEESVEREGNGEDGGGIGRFL